MKKIGYILTLVLLTQFSCKTTKVAINETTKPQIHSIKEILSKPDKPIIKALKLNRDSVFTIKYDTYQVFSKNGKLIESSIYENDGSLYQKRVNILDEKGVLIKGVKYNSNGKIIETWKYLYDKDGNMVEVTYYDNNGVFTGKQINVYDKNNNLTEYYYENSKGRITNRETYKYFKNGKIKELHRFMSDGTLRDRRTYEYDDNGNEIIDKAYKPDGSVMIYKSEYDKMNNIIENYWINEKGEQTDRTSFEYVYDKNGNWITKRRSTNGVLSMIWERKIEYFK